METYLQSDNYAQIHQDKLLQESWERNIIKNIKIGLLKEEFQVYYQPQIELKSKKIVGIEALLRWENSNFENIPPNKIISLAEKSSLIFEVSNYIMKKACYEANEFLDIELIDIDLAVNISSREFENLNFVSWISGILNETGLSAERLEIEITETTAVKNIDWTVKLLNDIKKMGIKIALDDFGTGYSSFKYLNILPIDIIKIDKYFIDKIQVDRKQQIIVSKIIEMAHSLGLKVIGEGVESLEELQILREFNCDEVQGYYFSKPINKEDLKQLMI
ncbi:EAL domain-containing protein [Clostridium sp. MSJ-11]|uniref:EAL domain-containing protein n=1 Tax=Clostridium mobile TaxID=2841512 RepID=A0ABS6EMU5_9CLOT|nr:EAL domain-containing protein [Clostridium mobile]MBU5485694.1 EAL domain-containing protein [Clostridium mobile]